MGKPLTPWLIPSEKRSYESCLSLTSTLSYWPSIHVLQLTTPDNNPQGLISACFPNAASLLVADLGVANHGLADGNWEERGRYLHALKRLMMMWKGDLQPIVWFEKFQWQEQDILKLENAMTQHYFKMFYNYFWCSPNVPCGLSHMVAMYHIPDPPQVTLLDPCPDRFYDVTILHLLWVSHYFSCALFNDSCRWCNFGQWIYHWVA